MRSRAQRLGARPLDRKNGVVELSHGSGGRAMLQLIDELFTRHWHNPYLAQGNDATVLPAPPGRLVVSTDGHVVTPLFFPGGDIGRLAVFGTVNDLAVMGATPLYLTVGFILEEGLALAALERIVVSIAEAAQQAGVAIVAGDTKVVERGKADGVFITTSGVGVLPDGVTLSGDQAHPGDAVLLSGTIGDHGMAILSAREEMPLGAEIRSDCAPLNGLVAAMLASGAAIRLMRDPTRGGLAATLNEIAAQSGVGIELKENAIPVRPAVRAACELCDLDPLNLANEGKLIAVCAAQDAERLLAAMQSHPLGRDAAIIGQVTDDPHHFVQMKSALGGTRMVDWLSGDPLPRIC